MFRSCLLNIKYLTESKEAFQPFVVLDKAHLKYYMKFYFINTSTSRLDISVPISRDQTDTVTKLGNLKTNIYVDKVVKSSKS